MHIAILTYGSCGDAQPFVALGVGLRRAGHAVTLAARAPFVDMDAAHGLAFAPLPGDMAQLSDDLANRAGASPLAQVRAISAHAMAVAVEVIGQLRAAVRGADLNRSHLPHHLASQCFPPQCLSAPSLAPQCLSASVLPPIAPRPRPCYSGARRSIFSSTGLSARPEQRRPVADPACRVLADKEPS